MKIRILLITIFALFFTRCEAVFAQDTNFIFSSSSTFSVSEDGNTHVVYDIKIINKTSYNYARAFSINVGFTNPKNIMVYDEEGKIPFEFHKEERGGTLDVTFLKRVAGIAEVNNFAITFDSSEIAKKRGSVWQVGIPGLSDAEDFFKYEVTIKTPPSFGSPTFTKPKKKGLINTGEFYFSKDELSQSGIELMFGDTQYYKFNLGYSLDNPHNYPIKTEIALPPDTNYQNVVIFDITPRPDNTYEDGDGNWLAIFSLKANSSKKIVVNGIVKVSPFPTSEYLDYMKKQEYLSASRFWDVNDPGIQKLAHELRTPYKIYRYVVENLSYSFEKATGDNERLGAKLAIITPNKSVCLEFTDLFVALARAAGIPTRSIEGYAYTENSKLKPLSFIKDVLHTWPEYYDEEKKAWIMIDPTWENTTGGIDYFSDFDFEHIAFVVKGKESTYPIPAGAYKSNADSRDIHISFADPSEFGTNKSRTIDIHAPLFQLPGTPIRTTVIIRNTGNSLIEKKKITLISYVDSKVYEKDVPSIPPFGSASVAFTLSGSGFLTNTSFPIKISFDGYTTEKIIQVGFLNQQTIAGGIFILELAIIFYTARKVRSIFIQGKKWQNYLRWKGKKP